MKQFIIIFLICITACASFDPSMKNSKTPILNKITQGKDIVIKNETIDEFFDLISLLKFQPINELAGFVTVHSNLYFQNCTFKKEIIASLRSNGETATQFKGGISFINCKFMEKVNFRSSVFHGPVDFSKSTFYKESNFQDAIFMQRSTFNECLWKGEGKFQQVRFYHTASFMDSWAKENMMFQEAVFRDDANFSITNYSKYVDFSLTRFYRRGVFNYTKWLDRATFANSVMRDDISFLKGEFGSLTFKGARHEGEFIMQGETIAKEFVPIQ